jgi:hypothetical protein
MGGSNLLRWDPENWDEACRPNLVSFRGLAGELPDEKGG